MSHPATNPGSRLDALDALRGGAMFLNVSLHAAMAYTVFQIPYMLWGVREPSNGWADLFCWWALSVTQPVFFLMAGFFAADLERRRGLREFAVNRAKRIALPLVVAAVLVLPLTFYAWAAGWVVTGRCTLREVLRMKFTSPAIRGDLYGLAHLWFLEYLLVMLLIFGLVRWALGSASRREESPGTGGWLDRWLLSAWRPLWLAVPTAVILWVSREQSGLDAVLNRRNGFIPDGVRLLHHGLFFAIGVWMQRLRSDLPRFAAPARVYLALAVPVFLARAWLLPRDWAQPLEAPLGIALVALGALFAWLIVFGLLGLALRVFNRPRPSIRYLADASYWVYLVHLPVVGLMQADLYDVPVPTAVKFAAILGLTLFLGLGSYHVLVRHTAIGRLLHGPRPRGAVAGGAAAPVGERSNAATGSRGQSAAA